VIDINKIESALCAIDNADRDLWIKIGMAIRSALGEDGFRYFDNWSYGSGNYNEKDTLAVWRSFRGGAGVNIATLFYEAAQNGWRYDSNEPQLFVFDQSKKIHDVDLTQNTKMLASLIWNEAKPAPVSHPYLIKKSINVHHIGIVEANYIHAPHILHGEGELLVIPMMDFNRNIWSIQFISESGNKAYLRGRRWKGSFFWLNGNTDRVYLCEGFATGASLNQRTGNAVACAFDAYSLIHVARYLATRLNGDQIVIMADDDHHLEKNKGIESAQKAADDIGALVRVPNFIGLKCTENDTDYNDFCRLTEV